MNESTLLSTKEVLAVLRVSPATFYRSVVTNPGFPKSFRVGLRNNVWRRLDIEAFINDRAAAANAQVPA